jgi:hypothetical protein
MSSLPSGPPTAALHRDLSAFDFLGFKARRFIVAVTTVLNFVFALVSAPVPRSSFETLCPACSREPTQRSDLFATNRPSHFALRSSDSPRRAERGPMYRDVYGGAALSLGRSRQ